MRGPGRGSLKKVGDCWIANYSDAQGKRRRINFGSVKADAVARLNKVIRERDLQRAGMINEVDWRVLRIDSLVDRYLSSLERREVAAEYVRNSRTNLAQIVAHMKLRRAGDCTPDGVEKYMDDMRKQGYSNSIIFARVACLARVYRYAKLPWVRVPMPKLGRAYQKRNARALTTDEQELLIAEALRVDQVKGTMVLFLLDTGARHGEARKVRWSDIKDDSVLLRASNTKTKQARTIPLSTRLAAAIEALPRTCPYVFPRRDGRTPMPGAAAFTQWLQNRARALGIPLKTREGVLHTHALRHTFATRLAIAGVPIQQAQYLTGHKNVNTLLAIYTHLQGGDLRSAIDRI